MARDILFRGFPEGDILINAKKFVYGDLVHDAFDGYRFIPVGIRTAGCYPIRVNLDSVGQFTGSVDKNGVKIFEGNVIDCAIEFEGADLPHRGIVVYNAEFSCFCTKNEAGETPFYKHKASSRVVVGNIFENGELMGGWNEKIISRA